MEEKQYFDNINGYYVKDTDARETVATFEDAIETNTENIATNTLDIESNTSAIEANTDSIKVIDEKMLEYSTVSYAHRGLSSEAPENSLAAMYKAGQHGCHGVEIDIQVSADNEIYLMHDLSVDRTTNGTGTLNELSSSYIDGLTIDSGNFLATYPAQKVPKLREVLPILNEYGVIPMLELKGVWNVTNLGRLIDLLKTYNFYHRCTIISFNSTDLQNIRTIDSDIRLALLSGDALTSTLINTVKDIGKCDLSLNYEYNGTISNELVASMMENNIKYGLWTVNVNSTAKTLKSAQPYLSFIVSDYGFGGKVKQSSKLFIGLLDSTGFASWQSKQAGTVIGYAYDNFSVAVANENTKEYSFTYTTPFDSYYSYYNGTITAKLEGQYAANYTIWTKGQLSTGFGFYIVGPSNTKLTFNELYSAIGTTYITFTITGY